VVEPYPSEKYAKVNWDDDIPIYTMEKKIKIIQMFQTTKQHLWMIHPILEAASITIGSWVPQVPQVCIPVTQHEIPRTSSLAK
jgi:hypothetical protein